MFGLADRSSGRRWSRLASGDRVRHVQRCADEVRSEQSDREAEFTVGEVVAVGGRSLVGVGGRRGRGGTVVVGRRARCSDAMVVIATSVTCFRCRGGVPIVARGVTTHRVHAPVHRAQ